LLRGRSGDRFSRELDSHRIQDRDLRVRCGGTEALFGGGNSGERSRRKDVLRAKLHFAIFYQSKGNVLADWDVVLDE
jgi:hypothetical protein